MMFGVELVEGDEECDGGDLGVVVYMVGENVG